MRQSTSAENSHAFQEIPIHLLKDSVFWKFTAIFILGPYFFKKTTHSNPVTYSVTAWRYQNILENFNVPQMQQCQCLDSITVIQDGSSQHIGLYVQQFLRKHFSNDRVINRAFRQPGHLVLQIFISLMFGSGFTYKKFRLSRTSDSKIWKAW